MNEPSLLSVRDLRVEFPGTGGARLLANDGVSLNLSRGETLGIVGESGSGKTTLARAVVGLAPIASGSIVFEGREVTHLSGRSRHWFRRRVQMVFQDPGGSLNPRMRVGEAVSEPLLVHRMERTARGRMKAAEALLERCGFPPGSARRYPHEFSGGQRQRIAIARALALSPDVLVCDEVTSALDVSVQAQVLNLLLELQRERGLAYLFITHDLAVARHMAHRIAVMKGGRIIESGSTEEVLRSAREEYTRLLLRASGIHAADVELHVPTERASISS
jgi:peptide/nickel transport system ATP-binding protein